MEKIYLHYDKDYYVAGETIWFKAYLYSNGRPSTLSNNFYVQLINSEGKTISTRKYPVKGAAVNGNIKFPDSLSQGFYHIRALTPGMLNNHPDHLYSKDIFVFNPLIRSGNVFSAPKFPPFSIQFFPEGGTLVSNILSVVAFKATDSLGLPVEISGNIKTDDGTFITSFKTMYDGIGRVQFRPQAGKKYLGVIEVQGQTAFYPLPEVTATGISLKVADEKGAKMFLISRNKNEKDYDKVRVVAVMNNMIVYENEIEFETHLSVRGHLLTDSLPSGILHFTVFDNEERPLAERLTYVNNGEFESRGSIEFIKKDLTPRGENIFDISFPDMVQRSFSVSITDAEISPVTRKENIISKLLLTDYLKEKVNKPVNYFEDKNDTLMRMAMDNLMLTHSLGQFSWKNILNSKLPEKKYQDNYLVSISGHLTDAKSNAAVSAGSLIIFMESEDSLNQHFEVTVGSDGKFRIDSLLFFGKAKLFYAYKTAQGKEKPVNISLDAQPVDIAIDQLPFRVMNTATTQINTEQIASAEIIDRRFGLRPSSLTETKLMAPVIVSSKSNKRPVEVVNERYSRGAFTAMGKINIDNINEPEINRSLNVYDYVRRAIKQVTEEHGNFVNRRNFSLFKPTSDARLNRKQDSLNAITGASPGDALAINSPDTREQGDKFIIAVFVNESPADASFLKTIIMDNVALIKFYEPGFIGSGTGGPGGTLSIYTKNEVTVNEKIEKLDHVMYDGYSLTKQFQNPDYGINSTDSPQDTRTTLYWNPELFTDANSRKVTIRFYNNDFSKKLKIIVEGFDATGRLIHIERMINE